MLVAYGDADRVIPRDPLERTWTYLNGEAGSHTTAVRDPGGHGLSAGVVDALDEWLTHLLAPGRCPHDRRDVRGLRDRDLHLR